MSPILPTILLAVSLATAGGAAPAATEAPAGRWFEDRTETAGVARPHHNRSFENPYAHIMEGYTALGAAVAVADYDGDSWEDLFVTDSAKDGKNLLYRNRGDFTFEEVGERAGVAAGNDAANASADALWFDKEGDGDADLLVVRFGRSLLYENRGDGSFREVGEAAGLGARRNAITAVAFDSDNDGDLDLVLGNYFAPVDLFDPETPRFFPESFETAANGGGVTLYRNAGDGTFADVTEAAGLAGHSGWTLDLGHADYDGDGDEDLYVAADFGTDRFFVNRGDGTFRDATEEAIGIDTKKGMNADWGDFDNDGLLDVYVTNITDEYMREGNFLWHNEGDGTFTDLAQETGS
ncbi:MAG TPA: VCBS repeat-containing protein, partial [Thermoanaerobaculia bacterium]|nr:VCBS repeat-containing protein [Thermoanaerobaculia bacterium]